MTAAERVDHHRVPPRSGRCSSDGFDAARLGAVDEPGRVQADRTRADARPGSAHEVAGRVEEDLVAVDVGVVVRHLDRLGSKSKSRGTNEHTTKPGPLEGLVDRRRLVDAADDRLEVVDGERPGVHAAVPADDVERVVWRGRDGLSPPRLRTRTGTSVAVDEERRVRAAQVPFGEGRALQELARRRQVACAGR